MATDYGWTGVLGVQSSITPITFANTAAEQTFSPGLSLYPNVLDSTGRNGRCRAWGTLHSDLVTPGTLRVRFYLGSTLMLDSTTPTLYGSLTDVGWMFECDITTVAGRGGAASLVEAQGRFTWYDVNLVNIKGMHLINTATITKDLRGAITPKLTLTRSVADADNTTTCRVFLFNVDGVI